MSVRPLFGPWCLGVALALGACGDPPSEPETSAQSPDPVPEATPSDEPDDADSDPEPIVLDESDLPTDPSVSLLEPGGGTPVALPPRTAADTTRRLVVSVRLTEGRKKRLHLPVVRLAGDMQLRSVDDSGSKYQWTPVANAVDASGDGVDPEFRATFEAALAVGDAPAPAEVTTDRWDVLTTLPLPETTDPHAKEVVAGQRLALSHLALPIPAMKMTVGSRWEVTRKIDLLGVPAWQILECTAKKIDGDQMEVDGTVRYLGIDGEPVAGTPLGLASVASVEGKGKLRARYDLRTALPIEMQLRATLDISAAEGEKAKRFGFELRVDEDFVAQADPRVTFKGQWVQGGLIHGVVAPGTKVWLSNSRVMVSEEGDFLLGFGRNAPPRARLGLQFEGTPTERHMVQVASREFEPEAIDGLPPEMVDLDKATRKALGKSKVRIKKIRNKKTKTAYYREGFRWPMRGTITSTYGRKRILNGEERGFHWGVDLGARVGTKVKAPAPGVVVFAEADVPLSGTLLILDHGHGLTSSFLHLDKLKVAVGDEVKAGQVIATSGNTGRSTGAHLDWRMNLFDTRIDPMTLVPPR